MDNNLFWFNLKFRHTKAVKANDEEIGTDIWNGTAAEVF